MVPQEETFIFQGQYSANFHVVHAFISFKIID